MDADRGDLAKLVLKTQHILGFSSPIHKKKLVGVEKRVLFLINTIDKNSTQIRQKILSLGF